MKSNLQLFRQCSKDFIPSQQIDSLEEFSLLANHLCDNKLLHPSQVKKLVHKVGSSNSIKFPFSLSQLEHIIMNQFGDKDLINMLDSFKNLKLKLRQVKGVLNIWKDKGLTKKQRYELQSIFQQGNSQLRELFVSIEKEQKVLGSIYEQEQQMIDALDQWVLMQKVQQSFKSFKEYQNYHIKLIEQQFNTFRVREVHFKQKINTSKYLKIQQTIGLDSRNDQPLQVTFIPKRLADFNAMNIQLLTFNAQKDLMLSSHFPRFLGYNTHSDPHVFLYFNQHTEGKNLAEYISTVKIQLEEDTPLFKYWAALLYQTLHDVHLMCSYLLQLPLTLDHFQISSLGLKLTAKHAKFNNYRQGFQQQFYQAQLLANLGSLILSLLKIESKQWSNQVKVKRHQNRNIVNCLLNAVTGHSNYKQKRVKSKITFLNCQTHPLFESPSLTMGETVIDNYQNILNYK